MRPFCGSADSQTQDACSKHSERSHDCRGGGPPPVCAHPTCMRLPCPPAPGPTDAYVSTRYAHLFGLHLSAFLVGCPSASTPPRVRHRCTVVSRPPLQPTSRRLKPSRAIAPFPLPPPLLLPPFRRPLPSPCPHRFGCARCIFPFAPLLHCTSLLYPPTAELTTSSAMRQQPPPIGICLVAVSACRASMRQCQSLEESGRYMQRSFLVSPTALSRTTCTATVGSLPRCCVCTSEVTV